MTEKLPFFSIVVPTYERPSQLTACLECLACQTYPRDRFEVIVVKDDGGTLSETEIARFAGRLEIRWHTQACAGPAAARNAGAACAKGEFLAFTDDDCWPGSGWLDAMAARFDVTADCAIGGRTLNAFVGNPYSIASQQLVDYLYDYYNADPNCALFFASNNLALPADRFRAVGGFDGAFPLAAGEDREFCDRWLRHGYQMIYAPEAIVYHAHGLTLRTFWHQHFSYGRGAWRFRKLCSCRDRSALRLECLSFYIRLMLYPLLRAAPRRSSLSAALLILSQAANSVGFCWEATNRLHKTG